ncbi:MAG: AMP-binding protein, partial [Planctomycetales bacterium]|nr:AMP-binding protein [Planctomycetales bacterium]
MSEPFATLPEALQFRGEQQADRPALHLHDGQKFAAQSWGVVVRAVLLVAAALDELGVRPGDRVATVSENRVEWLHVDLACAALGAVHAALHSVVGPSALAEQIADCRPRAIVVSTREIAARLGSVVDAAPEDAAWIGLDDAFAVGRKKAMVLREMVCSVSVERGRELLAESVRRTRPSDLSALIYTSGTTGDSKGVMLSHDNLVSNAIATATAYGHNESDLRLCWLPLSHVFARTCDFYAWLLIGGELALCRGRDFVLEDCREIRPTQIAGVPYFYEKAAHGLRDAGLADQPGALAAIFGGRMRRLGSGGAALPDHIADFYEQRGVPL